MESKRIASGLGWKLMERFGVQGVQFVLQIVLANLLTPGDYGVLSIMVIFTSLANVFIQQGFSTALIQNKDVDEDDYSSVFWVVLSMAAVLYGVLFLCAPLIAAFFEMPEIVTPFRVIALMLIPGAFNSVQLARIRRGMNFAKELLGSIGGIVISGVAGVVLALCGAGIWALVAQTLLNVVVACIVMWFTVRWRPRLVFRRDRVARLFGFGWKLMASGLLDTLYQDLRSIVIGKKYNEETLGFYNRGKQFPQFFITAINGAVQSVMLPAMSARQDDRSQVKTLTRNSIMLSAYIIFPVMAGLAGVAEPMVLLLLQEKWLPCVPYLQIYCFSLAFYPVHSCNLQAINAMGRSDIFLKLELIKKGIGIISLVIAVFCFHTPVAIAMTGAFTTVISCFVNAWPNKKLINYSYAEQMRDILPSFAASLLMCGTVLLVGRLALPTWALLMMQMAVGVAVYLGISAALRLKPFRMLLDVIRKHGKAGGVKADA